MSLDLIKITNRILAAIQSVPGVAGFYNPQLPAGNQTANSKLLHRNLFDNIEIEETDSNFNININIVLIEGINVKDVSQEVQIRARYEMEKFIDNEKPYLVNVFVRDILIKK